MRTPQFRLRSLLLLVAALAVLFAVCVQWPIRESRGMPFTDPDGTIRLVTAIVERRPTPGEWSIRVAIIAPVLAVAMFMGLMVFRGLRASLPGWRLPSAGMQPQPSNPAD